jgi:hypothetical protein
MITLRKELKRKPRDLRSRKVAKASLALYSVNIASGSTPYFLAPPLSAQQPSKWDSNSSV